MTAKTFQFDLVSPEAVLASEEAVMAIIPGKEGEFGVLADHAAMLSSLKSGVLAVHLPTGEVRKYNVSGGFADVGANKCTVVAEEAVLQP